MFVLINGTYMYTVKCKFIAIYNMIQCSVLL